MEELLGEADFEISIQTHFQVCRFPDCNLETIPNFFNFMMNSILLTSSNQNFIFCNGLFIVFKKQKKFAT